MLSIDVASLARGPVPTVAEIPSTDALLHDLDIVPIDAVRVRGRLTESGPGRYYWQAELSTRVTISCRRCLAPVTTSVQVPVNVLFAEDAGIDDPAVYPIPPRTRELDLSDAVREELILALPEYVLCSEDCRGICAGCGADLNTARCTCRHEPDARWGVLETLKSSQPTEER